MLFLRKYFLCTLPLLLSCAHQIPPGGGPDDKAPPKVYYTVPQRGALNVPKNAEIVIGFSKWIQPLNADKSLTMFPPPSQGLKVSVSTRKLIVKPIHALADSTTYHVSLNIALTDYHGNSIGTPYELFFSTGPTIDSSRIYGCVISTDGKPMQPKVALFPSAAADSSDTVLFGMPSYLTQTDSGGFFSFDNIHRGTYCCIAFIDDNNNGRLDPAHEQVFVPVRKQIVLDKVMGPVPLYPVVCDTTTLRIVTVKPVSAVTIYGEWGGASALGAPAWDSAWHIAAVEGGRRVSVAQYIPLQGSRRFFLKLSDTLGLSAFKLFSVTTSPVHRAALPVHGDTIRFNGVSMPDTVAPVVKATEPQGTSELRPRIKLTWSKPVIANFTKWYLVDSLGDSSALKVTPGYNDSVYFSFDRSLIPDTKYTIKFPDSAFSDICGNHPVDTTGINIGFRTMLDRDLCFSMSGGIPCPASASTLRADSVAAGLRKWMFMPIGGQKKYLAPDKNSQFRFDSIPSGKGTMGLFTDVNNDGLLTKGSLVPWIAPEPFRMFPDTIEARKNWDIEGVTFTGACEECAKRSLPKPSADTTKTK
jgi:Bacterial Ig-like domain